MDKQSTIAFIIIGVILVVWLYMNSPTPKPPVKTKSDSTLVQQEKPKSDTSIQKPVPKDEDVFDKTEIIDTSFTATQKPERIITVETDLVKLELTSKGGKLRKYYLKEYETWYNEKLPDSANFYDKHVQLINQYENGDFNLRFVTNAGKLINTTDLDFETDARDYYYRVEKDDSLTISFAYEVQDGKEIKRQFTFYGDDYNSKVDIEMINMDDVISSYNYDVEWATGINFVEENSVEEAQFSSASAYTGGEQVIVDADTEGEKEEKELNGYIDWLGVRNKYFGVIISPEKQYDSGAYIEGVNKPHPKWGAREYYAVSYRVPFNKNDYQKNTFNLFIGPLDYNILADYNKNYEAIYDFGSFFGLKIITRPISEYILLPLFKFLHLFIPNYGFVIIVFSLIIKLALYPLTKKSYQSMKRMQMLQPKIKELKEKHKDDPQKVQKETMKMYSTYGVNPMGGCLPMLLQMPILIALFTFFKVTIDIRHEPFIWWITNLSSPDVIYTLPFSIPFVGVDQISGLALAMGITMFFQQKMSIQDPSQKAMVYVMPVMLTLMFMSFPSGLNLYYFMFNLFSLVQQQLVNKKAGQEELKPVKDPKKKKGGGFMQKMMDAAEEKQKQQKDMAKKAKKNKRKF